MKITIVSDTLAPDVNGVAMTLEHLIEGLLLLGHGVSTISPVTDACQRFLNEPNFTRHTVDSVPLIGYDSLRLGLPCTNRLTKLWKDTPPTALYIATEGALGLSALKAAEKLKLPVVSGYHTSFHRYSKDYVLPYLEEVTTSYLRSMHNRTSMTLAPCQEVAEQLVDKGFKRVGVLGRGINQQLFNPNKRNLGMRESWGADKDNPVALYVGRIAKEKNLMVAIRSYQALKKINPQLRMVVAGDGPLLEELKAKYPDIHFPGVLRGEELAACYASADLFLFPSSSETYGNVIPEALASGLICVAFDYAAARELITDLDNGFLAECFSENSFIEKSEQALLSLENTQMREKAHQSTRQYSWENITSEFETCLKEAGEQHPAATA